MKKWQYAMVTAVGALPKNGENGAEATRFAVAKGTSPRQMTESKGGLMNLLASLGDEGWEAVGLTTLGVGLMVLLKQPL